MINVYHQQLEGVWYATAIEDEKVLASAFSSREQDVLRHLLRSLPYDVPFQVADKQSQLSAELLNILKGIFEGKGASSVFRISMDHLSEYTRKVLHSVSIIPHGYLTTYGAIAKARGGSPRAVGRVMASNPFPLLIPCHRVVRSDFSIGGYGLGKEIKLRLLKREDKGYKEPKEIKANSKILPVFPVKYLWKR